MEQRLGYFPPGGGGQGSPFAASGMSMAGLTEISAVTMLFRAVSMTQVAASANTDIAYGLLDELKASPFFEPAGIQFSTLINPDEASGTFTFGITATLQKPLKL